LSASGVVYPPWGGLLASGWFVRLWRTSRKIFCKPCTQSSIENIGDEKVFKFFNNEDLAPFSKFLAPRKNQNKKHRL
jgi:hypothetical protein